MSTLILQRFVPLITAFVVMLNNFAGVFGAAPIVPYNPERTKVVVSGDVITDVDEILEYYNEAVKNTGFVLGTQKIEITETPEISSESMGSAGDSIDEFLQLYKDTVTYVFAVPGNGVLTSADVKSAKMSVADGKRTIIINVKDYKHGLNDTNENNPITNAFGFSTANSGEVFSSVGMNVEKASFEYTDGEIKCIIDDESGKIIYGDWDSTSSADMQNITVTVLGNTFKIDKMSYKSKTLIDV